MTDYIPTPAENAAHEDRMRLINRPFFITHFDRSYPWGGTIVGYRDLLPTDCSRGRRASTRTAYAEAGDSPTSQITDGFGHAEETVWVDYEMRRTKFSDNLPHALVDVDQGRDVADAIDQLIAIDEGGDK